MSDISFEAIRATMPDNGNKGDDRIDQALSTLPIRVILLMTARELGRFVDTEDDGWEVVAAPLGAPGSLAGAVAVLRSGLRFGRRERVLVAQAGRLLGPSIAARRTLEDALGQIAELSEQALKDETTGLPNRRALLRWLAELGDDTPLAVLLIDFDGLRLRPQIGPSS